MGRTLQGKNKEAISVILIANERVKKKIIFLIVVI
jgi:hypothetical protein